jgi:hypothetical protein
MYEERLHGQQYCSERTWWPEMEDARERINAYKTKNCSGDLDLKVKDLKQ